MCVCVFIFIAILENFASTCQVGEMIDNIEVQLEEVIMRVSSLMPCLCPLLSSPISLLTPTSILLQQDKKNSFITGCTYFVKGEEGL